jgi:AICAR transformylase/IMP cyclohydrolase PurH
MTKLNIKNALISLTDKNKIEIVAKKLKELDINIISTGGTAKYLKSHSIIHLLYEVYVLLILV